MANLSFVRSDCSPPVVRCRSTDSTVLRSGLGEGVASFRVGEDGRGGAEGGLLDDVGHGGGLLGAEGGLPIDGGCSGGKSRTQSAFSSLLPQSQGGKKGLP